MLFMKIFMMIPILGVLNLMFIKNSKKETYFNISLFWSMLSMTVFSFFLVLFNKNKTFQEIMMYKWDSLSSNNFMWGGVSFSMDGISMTFIGLSLLLIPISFMMNFNSNNKFMKQYYIFMFMVSILLMMIFSIMDLLGFYILFETMLIPMFLMIGLWGSSDEKMKAAFYFFFYTLVGSILMLLSIFKMYSLLGVTDYSYLFYMEMPFYYQFWLFMGFSLSLLVKMPMIPTHMWLPLAHVEAPMSGSILLAGVLLKLGGYGFISFVFILFPITSEFFTPFFITLSMIATIYGALCTCSQMDMKSLIAYSSMSHMGLVTLSMFCHSLEGLMSSMVMMLAHGFISSGLFMMSSSMYFSFHSSMMKYYKGLAITMPIMSIITFILILGNISFPLTLNFMGELLSIISAFKYSYASGFLLCMGVFIGMVYSLYLYNSMFFGYNSKYLSFPSDFTMQEFNSFLPMILLTLILGFYTNSILKYILLSSYINISL